MYEYNKYDLENIPNECPYCHKSIQPIFNIGSNKYDDKLEIILTCPACHKSFIAYYFSNYPRNSWYTTHTNFGTFVEKKFDEKIIKISPSFVEIYNQSFWAEQEGLKEICGVGYRKALEFLIKDYCITNNTKKVEDIKQTPLGKVIKNYVKDEKIKSCAERAIWLGNDETHYVRRWEDKDLKDLKLLIELTVRWIEAEIMTIEYNNDMSSNEE